jgi:putative two-component system response regulator
MHHERLDGSGYPHGVKGVDIPTTVRILSIADVVESLTAERPYRHRATLNEVIDYLHSEEGKYDVTIVKLLEGLVKV